ncbi:MAG TPA: hypothetical protein VF633_09325 [Brevundimonas sp.]|jgi:hypothetical protein
MKASVSLPGDRTQARREEHRKAVRLTRVLETMTATILRRLAERNQPAGRFFWDGLVGEFGTSALVSTLSLRSADGSIVAEGRLRHEEWVFSIRVNLPDYALRGVYAGLHDMLNLMSYSDLEMVPATVH